MTDENAKQRTLEGLVVTDRDTLKDLVREVLREEGVTAFLKRASSWDREYKGHDHWLGFRAHAIQLIQRNVAISYGDLDQDRYFSTIARIRQQTQWNRAVEQHLIPNDPPGTEGLDVVTFSLGARGTRFVTLKTWLHCAIGKAAEGRKDPQLVREVRAKYAAGERCERCERCGPASTRSVSYSVSKPASLLSSEHAPRAKGALTDEESAILASRRAEE